MRITSGKEKEAEGIRRGKFPLKEKEVLKEKEDNIRKRK